MFVYIATLRNYPREPLGGATNCHGFTSTEF